jgi:hypothetical protein
MAEQYRGADFQSVEDSSKDVGFVFEVSECPWRRPKW